MRDERWEALSKLPPLITSTRLFNRNLEPQTRAPAGPHIDHWHSSIQWLTDQLFVFPLGNLSNLTGTSGRDQLCPKAAGRLWFPQSFFWKRNRRKPLWSGTICEEVPWRQKRAVRRKHPQTRQSTVKVSQAERQFEATSLMWRLDYHLWWQRRDEVANKCCWCCGSDLLSSAGYSFFAEYNQSRSMMFACLLFHLFSI